MSTMGSPQKWTSPPMGTSTHWSRFRWPTFSWPGQVGGGVTIFTTPGTSRASLMSIPLMMARG